jgi:hypothetical protein
MVTIFVGVVTIIVNWKPLRETIFAPLEADVEILSAPINPDFFDILETIKSESQRDVLKGIFDISKLPTSNWRTITHLEIKTGAVLVCHNIIVHIPEAKEFEVSRNREGLEASWGDQEVSIGDLRSGDDLDIYAWGGSFPFRPGWIIVTSNEAPATLRIPLGHRVAFNEQWIVNLVIVLCLVLVLFLMRRLKRHRPKEPDKLDD